MRTFHISKIGKSYTANGKRNIKIPSEDPFFKKLVRNNENSDKRSANIIVQSFASAPKKYELLDKGLEIFILRKEVVKIVRSSAKRLYDILPSNS